MAPVSAQVAADDPERYLVGSVHRALQILELVTSAPGAGLSLSDIARGVGVSKSTAYALVRTLVRGGHVRSVDPGPRYLPGAALIRLGDASRRRYRLAAVAQPVLDDLARTLGLLARATINHGGRPMTVAVAEPPGGWAVPEPLGQVMQAHCTASGKALLSTCHDDDLHDLLDAHGLPALTSRTHVAAPALLKDLALVRRRGFAVDDEEYLTGTSCVAVPLRGDDGECLGTVGVTMRKGGNGSRRLAEIAVAVRGAAARIGTRLAPL